MDSSKVNTWLGSRMLAQLAEDRTTGSVNWCKRDEAATEYAYCLLKPIISANITVAKNKKETDVSNFSETASRRSVSRPTLGK